MLPDMSKTIQNKPTDTKFENRKLKNDEHDVQVMRLHNNYGTSTGVDTVQNSYVQKLLAVLLAVTLDKVKVFARGEPVYDVDNILLLEQC